MIFLYRGMVWAVEMLHLVKVGYVTKKPGGQNV